MCTSILTKCRSPTKYQSRSDTEFTYELSFRSVSTNLLPAFHDHPKYHFRAVCCDRPSSSFWFLLCLRCVCPTRLPTCFHFIHIYSYLCPDVDPALAKVPRSCDVASSYLSTSLPSVTLYSHTTKKPLGFRWYPLNFLVVLNLRALVLKAWHPLAGVYPDSSRLQ